jgi:hypothetical protein
MKQTINTTIHGIGYLFVMVGFLMMVKAAGDADLAGTMSDIMRYSIAAIVAFIGGGFLTWWKV